MRMAVSAIEPIFLRESRAWYGNPPIPCFPCKWPSSLVVFREGKNRVFGVDSRGSCRVERWFGQRIRTIRTGNLSGIFGALCGIGGPASGIFDCVLWDWAGGLRYCRAFKRNACALIRSRIAFLWDTQAIWWNDCVPKWADMALMRSCHR